MASMRPSAPAVDELLRLVIGLVEAALEAHLETHSRSLHRVEGAIGRLQIERNRLLAEDLLARFGGGDDQRRVTVGRGGDDDGIDGRIGEHRVWIVRPVRTADLGRQRLRRRPVDVGDDRQLGARDRRCQCGGMTLPDPSRANERDSHPLRHRPVSHGYRLSAISYRRRQVDESVSRSGREQTDCR